MQFLFFFALLALLCVGLLRTGAASSDAVLSAFLAGGMVLAMAFWNTILRRGRWRGVLGLLPLLLLSGGCVLALGLGYDLGYGGNPGLMAKLLWARSPAPWLAAACGSLVGTVMVILASSHGDCAACDGAIRPWQAALHCYRHGSSARFHARCLLAPDQTLFTSHDPAELARLVRLSAGDFREGDLTLRLRAGTRPAVCRGCLKAQAMEALVAHCEHSDFLVPYANVIRHAELCSVCRCPAAEGPYDMNLVIYSTEATEGAGIEQEVERYQLGPLIACPHCDTRAHLMCWYAQGGCINRGNRSNNGRHCHMTARTPQRPNFFEKGWPGLCSLHAKLKGWDLVAGSDHVDVVLTPLRDREEP